ncbi:MAG: phage DNA encapsidation protein [Lachnospiraceae bacterium]|nr:phage DNA encapsidation protein [Lachnospiraceae bacterium]
MDEKMMYFPDWRSSEYYFFLDDVRRFPDAWCYVVWSRRGPGKTYSFLRSMYENGIKFAYMKRTIKDVAMICSDKYGMDLSPYVPVNRDTGSNIRPRLIADGIGAFYDQETEDGKPAGAPFSYVLALNAIKEIKGIGLSDVDYICMDEFIPQPGEVVKRDEGELLLSIYMTVQRDRMKRGRDPLKLVLFSNADQISTPITNELEIVDRMADLNASGRSHDYDEDRQILLHHITNDEIPLKDQELTGVFRAMSKTAWGRKAFFGDFAGNDFSAIGKMSIKGFRPMCAVLYRNKVIYMYRGNGYIYASWTRHNGQRFYDLSKESDQKRFYYEALADVREAHVDGRFRAESYSIYDLMMNFKKIYRIT